MPPALARATTARTAHHLIDPTTGAPAVTPTLSATVVAAEGWQAEALAKVAFLAPPEAFVAHLTEAGATGLVVTEDGVLRAPDLARFVTAGPAHDTPAERAQDAATSKVPVMPRLVVLLVGGRVDQDALVGVLARLVEGDGGATGRTRVHRGHLAHGLTVGVEHLELVLLGAVVGHLEADGLARGDPAEVESRVGEVDRLERELAIRRGDGLAALAA